MRFDEAGLDAYLKEIDQIPLLTAEEEGATGAPRRRRRSRRRATG